jgi:hypothetical protein
LDVVKRGRLVVPLVWGALCGVAACSSGATSSGQPLGHGDHLIVDVEASTLPPQPDAEPDPIFAAVDGSGMYGTGSGYVVFTVCGPSDGGPSEDASSPDDGAASSPDDGAAASPDDGAVAAYAADGAAGAACTPFPAACESTPDCVCLFAAFKAQIPCPYPSCGVMKHGFSVNCPP